MKVGDEITYQINYINYKDDKATVKIHDVLDANVALVSASNDGTEDKTAHAVDWEIKDVPAGGTGSVTLTVKVLDGAKQTTKRTAKARLYRSVTTMHRKSAP